MNQKSIHKLTARDLLANFMQDSVLIYVPVLTERSLTNFEVFSTKI